MLTLPNMFQEETKRNDKALDTIPNMLQDDKITYAPDVRKRDDKNRTSASPDNTTKSTAEPSSSKRIHEEKKVLEALSRLKNLDDKTVPISIERMFNEIKRPTDFKMDKFLKNKHESVNLNDVNSLIGRINKEITEKDNIVDLGNNEEILLRDLTNFLYDIRDGKVSSSNKEMEYKKKA